MVWFGRIGWIGWIGWIGLFGWIGWIWSETRIQVATHLAHLNWMKSKDYTYVY
jgi:hypothetical protein